MTASFPALFYRASKGDFTDPAQVWLNQTRDEIGNAMSYMMDCASGQTAARRERIAREEGMLEFLKGEPVTVTHISVPPLKFTLLMPQK